MTFLKSIFTVLLCSTLFWGNAQESSTPIVVLELFTSQGCSSCPVADELLEELKTTYNEEEVFVLSYHVDYWNRLGWKDPFSQKTFSDYQRTYSEAFGSTTIYTPQLIVNGKTEFVGGNKQKALRTITQEQESNAKTAIDLRLISKNKNDVEIDFKVEGAPFKNLTLALIVSDRITEVSRGENHGRVIKNANIVASRMILQPSKGTAQLLIPEWIVNTDQLAVIAYTQTEQLKIIGASRIKI